VTLAMIAALTAALQFDMQSRRSPQLAAVVPAPLRGHAQTQIVRSALVGQDAALAVREAERLVQRRPLPAENLILLAKGQAKAGQIEAAAQTIQIAGQRGWREPVAQEAVLRLALAAGDKPEAARRYAALFLQRQTPDTLLEELGQAVLGEPRGPGQQTMVAIIAGGERWHTNFLRRGARVMPPAAFSAIVVDSIALGVRFDCSVLKQSTAQLEQRDPMAAADLRRAAAGCLPVRP
jgi:hypothetical protein